MIDEKILTLVVNIRDRTNSGTLHWETTVKEGTFQVVFSFSETVVQISEMKRPVSPSPIHSLRILNEEGVVLEEITELTLNKIFDQRAKQLQATKKELVESFGLPDPDQVLDDIYTSARRNALGVDGKLDRLLNELK